MYQNETKIQRDHIPAGAGMLAGYHGDAAASRQPEVMAELERLNKACEVLGMVSERMVSRLEPIRRASGINSATGALGQAPQAVVCSVASVLRDRREQVERYTAQLQGALSELEI